MNSKNEFPFTLFTFYSEFGCFKEDRLFASAAVRLVFYGHRSCMWGVCRLQVFEECDVLIRRWTLQRIQCVWEPCSSYTPVISIWTSSFKMTAQPATCRPPGSVCQASTSEPRSQSKQPPELLNSDLWPHTLSRPLQKDLGEICCFSEYYWANLEQVRF